MTTRVDKCERSERSARTELLPLAEPGREVELRPAVLAGIGKTGGAIVRTASRRSSSLSRLCITDASDTGAIHRALSPRSDEHTWSLAGDAVEVLAIGEPADLAPAMGELIARLGAAAPGTTIKPVTLEIEAAGAPARPVTGDLGRAARYRFTRRFYHGRLSHEHTTDLVSRLLPAGLAPELMARAGRAGAGREPAVVGGALLWYPEVPIGRLVAARLMANCVTMLTSPEGNAARKLSTLIQRMPGPITGRLRRRLCDEAEDFIEQALRGVETAPVESLLEGHHAGEADAREQVRGWCKEMMGVVRQGLYGVLVGRRGPGTTLATLERGERELQLAAEGHSAREAPLAAERRYLARRAVRLNRTWAEAKRLLPPLRQLLRWVRGRKLRRAMTELFVKRTAELMARYERKGVEELQEAFVSLRGLVAEFLATAPAAADAAGVFRPDYPNLVPLCSSTTLESVLEGLILRLGVALREQPVNLMWRKAAARLAGEKCEAGSVWSDLGAMAEELATLLPGAEAPFETACADMLPELTRESVLGRLEWAGRPAADGEAELGPTEECILLSSGYDGHVRAASDRGTGYRGVVCVRWPG